MLKLFSIFELVSAVKREEFSNKDETLSPTSGCKRQYIYFLIVFINNNDNNNNNNWSAPL